MFTVKMTQNKMDEKPTPNEATPQSDMLWDLIKEDRDEEIESMLLEMNERDRENLLNGCLVEENLDETNVDNLFEESEEEIYKECAGHVGKEQLKGEKKNAKGKRKDNVQTDKDFAEIMNEIHEGATHQRAKRMDFMSYTKAGLESETPHKITFKNKTRTFQGLMSRFFIALWHWFQSLASSVALKFQQFGDDPLMNNKARPLFQAVVFGSFKTLKVFMQNGVDLCQVDENKYNILHYLIVVSHIDDDFEGTAVKIYKRLLKVKITCLV